MFENTNKENIFKMSSFLADLWKSSNLEILNPPHYFNRTFYLI